MTLPNFLIIGAAKSGTTSLYRYLGQHPDVFLSPVKEPAFFVYEGRQGHFTGPQDQEGFDRRVVPNRNDYEALFADAGDRTAIGEASVEYLYDSWAAVRIREQIPDAKLIVLLRDPAERAYSSFRHMRRDGREPEEDFGRALAKEEERIRAGWSFIWHYSAVGFYSQQLQRYLDQFPAEQISVFLYEDLLDDPAEVLSETFRFLGIDDTVRPDVSVRHNVSGRPRSPFLHQFLRQPSRVKELVKPLLPESARLKLRLKAIEWNIDQDAGRQLSKP